jgi:hypothetical protein
VAGDAAITINIFSPTTIVVFMAILEASYGNSNQQVTAQQRLNQLTMGNWTFPVFFAQFHQYSKETGWNDAAQINHLVESLAPDLKRTLIGVSLPDNLQDTANLINRYYNDLMRLNPRRAYQSNTMTTATSTPSKDPDAMDIDAGNKDYAPKNSPERQKRIKEGRCFRCGSKDHLSPKCSVPIPKRTLRTVEAQSPSTSPSRTMSPETVSLNESSQG